MSRLKLHTPDLTAANVGKVAALFPNCVTETRADDGTIRQAIDFDLLRQELSTSIVEGPRERYHLDWPGKREALLAANAPVAKTLRPCRTESVNFDATKNLFIEGDNLDALKLLQETYLGRFKLIYIDPPYNTGNDFIYEDDYSESIDSFKLKSNQVDVEGHRMVANLQSSGRFHSDWLSMIYPRLKLARNLLSDDGAIFISIDDNEVHNLRRACDEIFGGDNFAADIAWQKRYTRSNNTVEFTTVVEHLLVYRRSASFDVNLLPRTSEADSRYTNPDNDPRGPWKGASFLNPATPRERPNLCYPIQNPNTEQITNPTSNAWRRSRDEFKRLAAENRLYWGMDGKSPVPSIKMFLSDARGLTPINYWSHEYAGNTDQGTLDLEALMGGKLFNNPKPVKLLKRVLEHGTGTHDLILDFFAGSGTMAQAVYELNVEDGGKRRFVLIQLPEVTDPKSEANRIGYATIAEITKERIRRSGQKIQSSGLLSSSDVDLGFRVLKVDTSNMSDVYYTPEATFQESLIQLVNNIKQGRSSEDMLFQVLVDWGVDLTLNISRKIIEDKPVYFVDDDALVACFESNISESLVSEIAKFKSLRAVLSENCYSDDSNKINIEQIFKLLSPFTELRSI